MKVKIYFKKGPVMDTSTFIKEYQEITTDFMKEFKNYQSKKEDLMIEKLISMHSCTNMDAYNQDLMRQDIEELLSLNEIKIIKVSILDDFNPEYHEIFYPLYDNYKNYHVTKILENGFIRGNKVIKKALVEVERKQEHE